MKKVFILTGEPSGDKLASKVINDLKKINQNLEFLSVGGEHLQSLGIKSIYDLKEITYLFLACLSFMNTRRENIKKTKPDFYFDTTWKPIEPAKTNKGTFWGMP